MNSETNEHGTNTKDNDSGSQLESEDTKCADSTTSDPLPLEDTQRSQEGEKQEPKKEAEEESRNEEGATGDDSQNKIQVEDEEGVESRSVDTDGSQPESGTNLEGDDRESNLSNDEEKLTEAHKITLSPSSPYRIIPLIPSLPPDVRVSAIEAYEEHIYIGTETGELLHYFEIEVGNYLLISQTNFGEYKASIDKILLLPKVEKACILSNSQLVLFLLPEMAPIPNTEVIKGVNDVTLRASSDKNIYELLIFTEESILVLAISDQTSKIIREYDHRFIDKAVSHNNILMTSKLNTYEVIDLRKNEVHPLFRVSEGITDSSQPSSLSAIIVDFDKDSFLVCSGGSSYDTNCMALIVNHQGDITHGTVDLKRYPRKVVVEYPFILAQLASNEIAVYKLSPQESQGEVQSLTTSADSHVQIFNTSKYFSDLTPDEDTAEIREEVVDTLRLVPIHVDAETIQLELDFEKKYVEKIYEQSSHLLVSNNTSVSLLSSIPIVLQIDDFGAAELDTLYDYLYNVRQLKLNTKFSKIQRSFVKSLYLLLSVLHCEQIDVHIIDRWCKWIESVDVRILLYLLDLRIFGQIWLFNGLKKITSNLKSLKLINKCQVDDNKRIDISLLEHIKSRCAGIVPQKREKISNFSNILRTLDVNIFLEKYIHGNASIQEFKIDDYEEYALEDIIRILKEELIPEDIKYTEYLIEIYTIQKRYTDIIGLLKKKMEIGVTEGAVDDLINYISLNIDYYADKREELLEDLLFVVSKVKKGPYTDNSQRKGVLKRVIPLIADVVKKSQLDLHTFIESLGEEDKVDVGIKVLILERIGLEEAGNREYKEYLLKYYILRLRECVEKKGLWSILQGFTNEYKHDMDYEKVSIMDFLRIKLKSNDKCGKFNKCCSRVNDLCVDEPELLQLVGAEISKFDKDNILLILFILFADSNESTLRSDEKLHILMEYNDFLGIERELTTEDEFFTVLDHYCSELNPNYSATLIVELMQRNPKFLRGTDAVRRVLQKIPKVSKLSIVSQPLLTFVRRQETKLQDLELEKGLLKHEISIYKEILNKLDT